MNYEFLWQDCCAHAICADVSCVFDLCFDMCLQSSHKTLSNYCGDFITNMIFQSLIMNGEWFMCFSVCIVVIVVAVAPLPLETSASLMGCTLALGVIIGYLSVILRVPS